MCVGCAYLHALLYIYMHGVLYSTQTPDSTHAAQNRLEVLGLLRNFQSWGRIRCC